ncbi:unnamed protein product [Urochloa humidicola]
MSGPVPIVFYSSDLKEIRRFRSSWPEARDDLPAPVFAASPIRRPPSVHGAVGVDIGPPIASRSREEAKQQLIKMGFELPNVVQNTVIYQDYHACMWWQDQVWKAEDQQIQEDGSVAPRKQWL